MGMITSRTGKPTSKAKVSLGINEEDKICWIPLDLTEELRELLMNWNSQLNIEEGRSKDEKNNLTLHMRLRTFIHDVISEKKDAITEVAEKFAVVHGKSLQELQKEVEMKTAALNRQMAAVEKMKSRLLELGVTDEVAKTEEVKTKK